jgi:hypothetical protein
VKHHGPAGSRHNDLAEHVDPLGLGWADAAEQKLQPHVLLLLISKGQPR